jgi:hypothetical protein
MMINIWCREHQRIQTSEKENVCQQQQQCPSVFRNYTWKKNEKEGNLIRQIFLFRAPHRQQQQYREKEM